MATFTKKVLSGSVAGKAILVAATATPGTLVHTGPTRDGFTHEVWLYASNADTVDRKLTIEWGDANTPLELTVPAESGMALLLPGLLLGAADTPLTVRAFCATASVVSLYGYIGEATE